MKRFFSSLLIFAMIFTMLPTEVWGTEPSAPANLIITSSNTVRSEAGERETLEKIGRASCRERV